jgi:hypothetical protein
MAITVDPNEPFHVLLGGQVTPVSLDVLDTLYQADRIEESTLIWQQGLGAWLRLDVVLAELEKEEPPAPQQREVEPDSYYVNFGDSDVRLLSLDQLSKFYDLEVIEDSTLVWQPGFAEWVPLAVLIGEADAPPVSIHPSLGPQVASSRPAPAASSFMAPVPSMAAPRPQSVPPRSSTLPGPTFEAPAPSMAAQLPRPSAPPAPSSRPLASVAATPSRPAMSALPGPASRPYSLMPNSLQEVQALTLSAVPPPAKASPWFGRGLLAASLFVGLLVVQRNGVMMDMAEGAGQAQSWQRVEASVGGTSVDTPQGLAVWLSDLSARHGLASLTPTEPLAVPEASSASQPAGAEPAKQPAFKLTPLPPPAPAKPAPDPKAETLAAELRARLEGKPARPEPATPSVSRPAKASGKSKKKSGGADAYDPMNGTL